MQKQRKPATVASRCPASVRPGDLLLLLLIVD